MEQEPQRSWGEITSAQGRLIATIAAVAVGSVVYRLLVRHHLEQTSLLFIGLPTVLAVVLAMAPPAKTLTGGILRGISLFLLLCGPLLGEGFICVLMAAPLFLLVGLVVGLAAEYFGKRHKDATLGCCLLLLAPMSLEGTSARLSFARVQRVEASAVVAGSVAEVRERTARSPRVAVPLPTYLRMGFPRPLWAAGEGLAVGNVRRVHFAGGEGAPGDMVLRVAEAGPGYGRFVVASDECAGMHSVGHWVGVREAEVRWAPAGPGRTRVSWALTYERRLDPAWYFGPWERYGVGLAARYLIDANAGGE